MTIDISNFGEMLMSRPSGREAFLGASAYIFSDLKENEEVILDFAKVKMLTPSWADEFVTGVLTKFTKNVQYINTENPSVKASLQTILNPIDVTTLKAK